MTGKIESAAVTQLASSAQTAQANKAASGSTPRIDSVREADSVTLSGQGANLNELVKVAEQTADIDVEKVAEIRAAIETGSYQVNAESVATKMAHVEWQLGAG